MRLNNIEILGKIWTDPKWRCDASGKDVSRTGICSSKRQTGPEVSHADSRLWGTRRLESNYSFKAIQFQGNSVTVLALLLFKNTEKPHLSRLIGVIIVGINESPDNTKYLNLVKI